MTPPLNQVRVASDDLRNAQQITASPAPNAQTILYNIVISADMDMTVFVSDDNETTLELHLTAKRPIQVRGPYRAAQPNPFYAKSDQEGRVSITTLAYEETVE